HPASRDLLGAIVAQSLHSSILVGLGIIGRTAGGPNVIGGRSRSRARGRFDPTHQQFPAEPRQHAHAEDAQVPASRGWAARP
ncbi:MAG TPA: hypothetical protein VFI39_11475, partial [Gemmatimonadales bacterium]|nr:hypothetical protein [Gemmatimonadales bacterium]